MTLNKKVMVTGLALAISMGSLAVGATGCATTKASTGSDKAAQKGCGANGCGADKGSEKSCGAKDGEDKAAEKSCGAKDGSDKGSDKSCGANGCGSK